jgi:hypothetical protein
MQVCLQPLRRGSGADDCRELLDANTCGVIRTLSDDREIVQQGIQKSRRRPRRVRMGRDGPEAYAAPRWSDMYS